jgi:hypothetical protein
MLHTQLHHNHNDACITTIVTSGITTVTTPHIYPESENLLLMCAIQKVRLVWMNCRTYNKGTGFDVVASK